ncbi:MAG: hypothetical protein FWE71_12985 [Nocardioidaceae bacterium]|nr:hypothetical protein [Nocardioidaceae bacterium]MCL2612536.1 hypothetical protein [Nocardioidaceae bacterium]
MAQGDRDQREDHQAPSTYVADGGSASSSAHADAPRHNWALWFLGGGFGVIIALCLVFVVVLAGGSGTSHVTIDPMTSDGYAQFIADLASGPGDKKVLDLEMNDHYAEATIAEGPGGKAKVYDWDGDFGAPTTTTDRTDQPFDLSGVAISDWPQRCAAAEQLLGDPKATCSVSISSDVADGKSDWVEVSAHGPTSGDAALFYDRAGHLTGRRAPK